jgi:dTDP-L-rhamnose 4-epimerase
MRILITGGAGFIGTHLARRLKQDGYSVVLFDNLSPQVHGDAPKRDDSGFETIWADVRDTDTLARALAGVSVVYHLAAETGVGQSQYEVGRYVSVNTYGTAVLLEAAAAARVRHVVIASSRAVYGEGRYRCAACEIVFGGLGRRVPELEAGVWDQRCPRCAHEAEPLPMGEYIPPAPTSVYGVTKWQQEQLARAVSEALGLPITILRFFNVYGPGQSLHNPYVGVLGVFFRRALNDETVEVFEDGQMRRDFVYVADVVEAIRLCTGNERSFGQTLNVGTGASVTLLEIAYAMFEVLGREPRVVVSGRYRIGDVRHASSDPERLEKVLGFRPMILFAHGLPEYVAWALENQAEASDGTAEQQLVAHGLLRQGTGRSTTS